MMPLDGGCSQQMAIALPITGAGSYQLGSTIVINIPRCSADTVFDPMNSFLRFNVHNADGTGVLVWDHSVSSLVKKCEVLHAGNLVESIDNYPQLAALLLDTQVEQISRILRRGLAPHWISQDWAKRSELLAIVTTVSL